MTKRQRWILLWLGLVLVILLVASIWVMDVTNKLTKSREEFQTTLNAMEAEHEKTMTSIHH